MTGTLSADTETFRLPRGPWLLIGLVMYLPVILLVHRAVDIAVCLFPVSMFGSPGLDRRRREGLSARSRLVLGQPCLMGGLHCRGAPARFLASIFVCHAEKRAVVVDTTVLCRPSRTTRRLARYGARRQSGASGLGGAA